jgi:phosphoserine phosphatase RsbU/P
MTEPFVLIELAHDGSVDTGSLRTVALRTARLLACDDVDSTRVATSVSELARLAPPGAAVRVRFAVQTPTPPLSQAATSTLTVSFDFAGAGAALTRAAQTAVSRLMDSVRISEDEVVISRGLGRILTDADLGPVRDGLLRDSAADTGALLQSINDELVAALVELREREADLVQLNAELDETNRGVVALYAELEQRSAQVRAAQRVVFEELADALRPPPPVAPGVELAVSYLPAQENSPTGGDLYDWFTLSDGTLHLSVIDVLGHGVLGTRDALHVTHTVRTLALDNRPLDRLLSQAHDLVRLAAEQVVATALVAQFDPVTGVLRLAGAGHPPALRVSAAGVATYLEAPGRPIGYEGGGSRTVSETALDPGDTVLLYTDGLIEIRRDVIEGMDRLSRAAAASRHLPLPNLLSTTVALCADGATFDDDTLLLGLRWAGPPAGDAEPG